ncbi:MAG: hypothetical protein F6K11_31290 [Leptolyngbya sp. SIO3F4]|nr:hypothetical protein [Leptolyngbya sp. SIO3F4]
MTYTTQQLIDILDQELKAAWRGERVLLSTDDRLANPVVSKAIGADKLSKVFAYQDFRAQIHQYQRDHNVSGVVWHPCTFKGNSIQLPEIHPDLTAIPADKATLVATKAEIIQFWRSSAKGLRLWEAGYDPIEIDSTKVDLYIQEVEWADLTATRSELYLGLCWGNPKECYCGWAYPESGCHRIIASAAEPSAIKV